MTHSSQAGLASFSPHNKAELYMKAIRADHRARERAAEVDGLKEELAAARAAAWDEGYRARFVDGDYATNPYRTKEGNA